MKIRIGPGNAARTHITLASELITLTLQPPILFTCICWIGSHVAACHDSGLEDEPSSHPPSHRSPCHVRSCAMVQGRPLVAGQMVRANAHTLILLCGLHEGPLVLTGACRTKSLTSLPSFCGQLYRNAMRCTSWITYFKIAATEAIYVHSIRVSEKANMTMRGLDLHPSMGGTPQGHVPRCEHNTAKTQTKN